LLHVKVITKVSKYCNEVQMLHCNPAIESHTTVLQAGLIHVVYIHWSAQIIWCKQNLSRETKRV